VLGGAGRTDEAEAAIAGLLATGPLASQLASIRAGLAEAKAAAGQGEASLAAARAQARALPHDPAVRVAIARLEDLLGRPEKAETALREALALDPGCAPALLALADLAERGNRIDELATLLRQAAAIGIAPPETALLTARLHYRRGELAAALAAADAAPPAGDGGARAELIGRIRDRQGDRAGAFAAFAEMNREAGTVVADPRAAARAHRESVLQTARIAAPLWERGWFSGVAAAERPAPVFLLGFPRSGTTLLDTMLAGHDAAVVLEEKPILEAAAQALGDPRRLPDLDAAEVATLRARYFEALDAAAPDAAGRLTIDKLPLGLTYLPLIHRLFPEGRIIFVERHPCDVVLSGFMVRFDPRGTMAHFLDLEDTALFYDAVMQVWRNCRAALPMAVHEVRYERLVDNTEAELRPLLGFLGLDWDARLLGHGATARGRGHIGSASYAQVTEAVHARAKGRWTLYREQLAPVLPILAPWAERMGYEI